VPVEGFDVLLQINEKNLHSNLAKQDVLILTGKKDHMIPFKMHNMQVKALNNAKSVTARVFTKEEHAQNHCQIGNIGLVLDVMVKWIDGKSLEKFIVTESECGEAHCQLNNFPLSWQIMFNWIEDIRIG